MLSKAEITRYNRQLLINGWGNEAQEKLKQSTVFVAGVGGLGSPLLYYLAVAGIGTLKICDFDKIDLSNLNRQILHTENEIGILKVDSAYNTLINANPNITIIKVNEKLGEKNTPKIVGDADIIVDCLDNFYTRQILNETSVKKSIPMIHAGVSGFIGQITFIHPPDTPCLACFFPDKAKKEITPIVGATAGILGSLQALEVIKYLTGIGENLKNKLLFWDGLEMNFKTIKLQKNCNCKICSKHLKS
ncbi:MAG: HesA/MoeB/ThiF family protein [Spirochaetota bacterium]|nr:HesA/MoeB/ThiF family protein [Spirochaetota bacterium]